MNTYLLDANVLIALAAAEHVHHDRARAWFSTVFSFALCPIVEGALVRYMLRLKSPPGTATTFLQGFYEHPACTFWADSLSYADLDLGPIMGHGQATDAYLVRLAESHGALLATLDEGLAQLFPGQTVLLPES